MTEQPASLTSFPPECVAVVIGATGGIGGALVSALEATGRFEVLPFSRKSDLAIDIEDENSIRLAAQYAAKRGEIRLVVTATGFLHGSGFEPEKSWRRLDPVHMAKSFAINAIGPALLMKHFLPLLPRAGKSVFAALSAKVGSIADNRLGGWHSYRASKAALNQLVRTAAIELKRSRPESICVVIHPGTVATALSAPYSKEGLSVQSPSQAADEIIACLNRLKAKDSGGFLDRIGAPLPW